ncbi:energy transducer TonB [Polynucleobacter paneuropaeus]|nr:energy transducer TonB [Polynucleobacter paneuropaeus]MBT8532753.1 energy transducer TonB [Polynucleobacter paneuropaeus]MBT8636468.1 energy transducer TonB [Polynucleobacter paneuropaeus]MBT8638275.1 energy transducer TonB [Polynucleobacter paneuropaeus]QWC99945.1 energy transducer TonB [Polynucleobacter paneuropaeus]
MRFASIYIPSYAHQEATAKEFLEKYWRILLLVLALHAVIFSLLSIKQTSKSELSDELQIDLSNPVVIPKSIVEKIISPQSEQKQVAASRADSVKSATQSLPIEAPQNTDNTPVVKFNEGIIKPLQAIKPIKVEPIPEKPLPVIEVQKTEEKKVQPQKEVQQEVAVKTVELKQAEPKPAEVIAPTLPAIVDKKNKDKDAPEVAPPSKGAGTSSASNDAAKLGGTPAAISAPGSTSSSASSGNQSGGQSGAQSSNQPSAQASSSGNEMQAQLSGGKAQSPGSSSGTADADYKSESLRNAQPRYPIYSRKMRQEGVVIITAEVLTDGSATDVRMATSSGIKLLDEAALETVRQWRFIPAKRDGVPYVQRLRIPVTFSLNK